MTPLEIRIELLRRGIRQTEIARTLGVHKAAVCRTIDGRLRSPRIRRAIAQALERPLREVFPDDASAGSILPPAERGRNGKVAASL